MKVRFLADYDFNGEIVDGLLRRESSIDVKTGFDAGLQGIPDPEVLGKAADEGRVLVTHDQRTMPRHFAEFILGRQSPGARPLFKPPADHSHRILPEQRHVLHCVPR